MQAIYIEKHTMYCHPSYKCIAISIMIVLFSCDENRYVFPEGSTVKLNEYPVVFEYKYINFAWGYQHQGWIIDGEGNIHVYNLPSDWQYPDSTGFIMYDDLVHNLSQTDSVVQSVPVEELMAKAKLIPLAKDGEITQEIHQAYDAGCSMLFCYFFDPVEEKFQLIFLAQSGDFEKHNTSPASIQLTTWLKEFGVFWLN